MGKTPCCNAEGLKKGAWTADEDRKLIAYIEEHGEGGWRTLPQKAGLQRCGKSCRLRWANYLRPDIKRGEFSSEEEQKIIELHAAFGNRWSAIARHLPRRTDNEIKNYWNTYLKKRLANMGIDPVTHMPMAPSVTSSKDTNSNDLKNTANSSPQRQSLQPGPSRPSSALARLLNNKLTPKLASSRCLDAFKYGQSHQSISMESDSKGDNDIIDVIVNNTSNMESPSLILGSPGTPLTMQRPVSTSARLLNKMASKIRTPLHCLNTLKSILSKSMECGASDDHGTTSVSVFDTNEVAAPPPEYPFDLDLLLDWHGVSADSLEGDFVGGSDGILSTSIGQTYNIESHMCSPNFMKNASNISVSESSNSLEFLGSHEGNEALATYDHEMSFGAFPMEHTNTDHDHFMEGSTNFILGDSSCDHVISTCCRGSHNGGESDGGVSDANFWNEDFTFEN